MAIGIKIHKKLASISIELLKKVSCISDNYKIFNNNEFVFIPITNINNLFVLQDIKYDTVDIEFESKIIKKKSIKEIMIEKIPQPLYPFIPTAFDQIGKIAIIDIKDELKDYKNVVGRSILDFNSMIKSVYCKSSKVDGLYRLRGLEFIGGVDSTITIHKEHGIKFYVDLSKIYFSPRLSNEHQRIALQVKSEERVFDMFCALAPFAFHILSRINCDVTVLDINPSSKLLIKKTIKLNKNIKNNPNIIIGDAKEINYQLIKENKKFTRIIMNHPSGSILFLQQAIDLLDNNGVIHFYLFAPIDNFEAYCDNLLIPYENIIINNIHRVRQSSPSEYHLCIDIIYK